MAFTHLHLHTEYSLLDGACRIEQLVRRVKELGQTAVAITDHGGYVRRDRLLPGLQGGGDQACRRLRGLCGSPHPV